MQLLPVASQRRKVIFVAAMNGWVATCPDCNWARFGLLSEVHDLASEHRHDKVWLGPKPISSDTVISAAVGTVMNASDPRPISTWKYGYNRRPNVW